MLRFLEELSLSALPALEIVYLDGWVARLAGGSVRRANSVNPLYPGRRPLDENLAEAEALYRGRGQPVLFKLTPASLPAGLDEALAARGYAREATTSVQTLDLAGWEAPHPGPTVLAPAVTEDWLAAAQALSAGPPQHQPIQRQILTRLAASAAFASLSAEGQVVSLGRGVVQSGWLGLYDIVSHPAQRGRGHARQLITDLLAWAVAHGAHSAYLQVVLTNAPALRLYDQLGFRELYQYWYRVKD